MPRKIEIEVDIPGNSMSHEILYGRSNPNQHPISAITNLQENLDLLHSTFIYEQNIPSSTWVIEHNLDKYPSITLVDTAGTVFVGEVIYNDKNTCTVIFNNNIRGKAYIN